MIDNDVQAKGESVHPSRNIGFLMCVKDIRLRDPRGTLATRCLRGIEYQIILQQDFFSTIFDHSSQSCEWVDEVSSDSIEFESDGASGENRRKDTENRHASKPDPHATCNKLSA